jgi:hypothetical protein
MTQFEQFHLEHADVVQPRTPDAEHLQLSSPPEGRPPQNEIDRQQAQAQAPSAHRIVPRQPEAETLDEQPYEPESLFLIAPLVDYEDAMQDQGPKLKMKSHQQKMMSQQITRRRPPTMVASHPVFRPFYRAAEKGRKEKVIMKRRYQVKSLVYHHIQER